MRSNSRSKPSRSSLIRHSFEALWLTRSWKTGSRSRPSPRSTASMTRRPRQGAKHRTSAFVRSRRRGWAGRKLQLVICVTQKHSTRRASCWSGRGRSLPLFLVLDRFEQRAAFAAAVLEGHRLRAEERDHLGVTRAAVWALRQGAWLRLLSTERQTASPRGLEAWRRCPHRWRHCVRAAGPGPRSSSRPSRRELWSRGALAAATPIP